jgi:hypothetical protein
MAQEQSQPADEASAGDDSKAWYRRSPELVVALVSVLATTSIALAAMWQADRQSDRQFSRDLVKEDRAELRGVLDATNETAARVTTDFVNFAGMWLKGRPVSTAQMDKRLRDSTGVAARLAVRLNERAPLPLAYQRLNHQFVVIRNAALGGTRTREDLKRVSEAALELPSALADVWNASFEIGRSRLTS